MGRRSNGPSNTFASESQEPVQVTWQRRIKVVGGIKAARRLTW